MSISSYLIAHERLIIVIVAAVVIWIGVGKYQQIRLDHDNAVLTQQKLITAAQVSANQQMAQQAANDKAQLQILTDKVTAQNAALVQANTQLATALSARQRVDASLPLPDLSSRWTQLVPQAVPVASGTGVLVNQAGAVATVQALEQVAPLKQELANETTAKANDDSIIASQTVSLTDLNKQVNGLNLLIVDNAKQCTDQIAVVKAEARKSKRRWFIAGFITGFVSHVLLSSKGL